MENDGRILGNYSYGGPARMDRLEQIVIPQHSTLAQPRVQVSPEGANPLDLTSAIVHELQRSNNQPGWHSWNHQLGGIQASPEQAIGLQVPSYGSYLYHQNAGTSSRPLPQNIPRFEESLAPSMPQMPTRLDYSAEAESLASAHQGFYSRSANGISLHLGQQVLENSARLNSTVRSTFSPWIDRMMQTDVTPTPAPSLGISTSLSLAQRSVGDVSCVASQTIDFHSCHSSDVQIVADLCTDDEDLETRPIDEKRKKRMLSNRASAQRSRQRRQERLDQLEVLTAQLRVENSTLQKKLSAAIQVAKKFEDQNKNLQKKVEKLTQELEGGKPKKPKFAAFDECASSQQTTCASSCEMVGDRTSLDPNLMRGGNTNDGASTPSMSAGSPGWPSGSCPTENEREVDVVSNGNRAEVSPVRISFSACRVGKKRSFDQSEEAAAASLGGFHSASLGNHLGAGPVASQPSRLRPTPASTGNVGGAEASNLPEPRVFGNSLALDPALKDDSTMNCLETNQWLEFAECFK